MKKRNGKTIICVVVLILSQFGAQAQRIYPNASGYGTDSRGAYQLYKETGNLSDLPKILYVNTLDGGNSSTSANSGTLSWCLSQNYPRIILFSVGGVIDWSVLGGDYNWFQLKSPYCNIYGQSAPAPGITIIGGKLHFQGTHDILVQHLKIRPIDNVYTWGKEIDCIGGWAGNHHIVIDHCSFSWSIDELIGFNTANDLTFSNCIFSEPLDHNTHPSEGDQYHAMLATLCYVQRFSSIGNLYAHGRLRAPFFNGGTQDIYISNNLIYNLMHGGIYLRDEWDTEALTKMDIVNNYYKPGLNTSSAVNYMVYIRGDVNPGAEFYINGNHSPYTNDQLSSKMVNNVAGIKLQTTTPLVDHKGHVPIKAKDVPQYIYKNAGAFHWDRDMTDKRIIQSVIDSNGVIIDSTSQLKNLYININKVTHILTLPAGPNEDKNGDGFTNIEEWLYRLGSSDIVTRNSLLSAPDAIISKPDTIITKPDPIPTKPELPVEGPDSVLIYIDPANTNDNLENGSLNHPFDSWSDIQWEENMTCLVKKNTSINLNSEIEILSDKVVISSYGKGDMPIIKVNDIDVAFQISDKANIKISDITFESKNSINAIYITGDQTNNILIENCKFIGFNSGIKIDAGKLIECKNNFFKNNTIGIYSMANRIEVYYNIFSGNSKALEIMSQNSIVKVSNNVLYNNIFGLNSTSADIELYNNIFYFTDQSLYAIKFGLGDIKSDFNLYFPVKPGFVQINNNTFSSIQDVQQSARQEVHSIKENPMFIDVENDNFDVMNNSPVIDAGFESEALKESGELILNMPDIGLSNKQRISTSIATDKAISQLSLYPNPCNGKFYIKIIDLYSNEFIYKVTIVNISGQVIYKKELNESDKTNEMEFDISNQSSGVYIVNLQTSENRKISKSIVVNNNI